MRATPCSCAGGRSRPRRRVRPRLEQRACPCGGRDGRLPSRKPSQPAQAPTSAAPPAKSGPPSHRIGEVRSLSVVCVCVSGCVGRVWSCGRSSPVLVVWGGSPASDWLVFSFFPAKEKISVGASFVSGCQSGVLFVCLLACLLRQESPRPSCSAVFVVVALARARLAIGVACTHTSGG